MSDETTGSASASRPLPDAANLDWLRKQAKRRLTELRAAHPDARLADAQFALAKEYGFPSWRALKAHIDLLTVEGQLVEAARSGDATRLTALLDEDPERLHVRSRPYEWTLLHAAAHAGQLATVDLLLARGLDVNAREKGDNTYPMHWAAAAGAVDVVQRLIDAGGDVIGHGDDHALEVIGWATCWDGCDDAPHHAVVDLLLAHGARHHIFSAIAYGLDDDVRRIVAANPAALLQQQSHNEDFQRPLHFAVRKQLPRMVSLLIELGADPRATDASGYTALVYATSPEIDRAVLEAIRASGRLDLLSALALHDWDAATRLLEDPATRAAGGVNGGALHLLAKRGDALAVRWLLEHGADPNVRWAHWDAEVTPLHLAALGGHPEIARILIEAGADPTIRDSRHDADALGWAEFFGRVEMVRMLRPRAS